MECKNFRSNVHAPVKHLTILGRTCHFVEKWNTADMELRERKTQATLKEKISDHYRNRDFSPKKKDVGKLGVMFFWGMTISLFFEAQFVLIPYLYSGWHMIGMILLAFFTLFGTFINWMGMFFGSTGNVDKDSMKKHFPDATETPKGWKFCPTCQVLFPLMKAIYLLHIKDFFLKITRAYFMILFIIQVPVYFHQQSLNSVYLQLVSYVWKKKISCRNLIWI